MQRFKRIALGTGILLVLANTTAFAQGKGNGGQKPQAGGPKAAQSPKPSAVAAPKNQGAKSTRPVKAAAGSPAKGPSKAVKTTRTGTTTSRKSASVTAAATTTSSTSTPRTTTSPSSVSLTPVQQKLQKNTNLAGKLQSRLPPGTDLMKASAGFRNLGQFVAAVNVSNNLGIPFARLKTKMVDDGLSLGQSIKALKPAASAQVEANRAEYDARGMISESESTTTTVSASASVSTTTTTTTGKKPKGSNGGGPQD